MKRAVAAFALLAVACGGLLYNQGNSFPCDFTAAEEVRDKACAPAEVCTVLNRCERFVYEGPQFEGPPNFPAFDAGRKVHPLVLDRRVQLITANAGRRDELLVVMSSNDGGPVRSVVLQVGRLTLVKDGPASSVPIAEVGVAGGSIGGAGFGAYLSSSNDVRLLDGGGVSSKAKALRVGPDQLALLRARGGNLATALIIDRDGNLSPVRAASGVVDLRFVPPSMKGALITERSPILLTQEGFFLADKLPDGGPEPLTPNETAVSFALPHNEPQPDEVFFRHDPSGALWALARKKQVAAVAPTLLSTWQLTRKGEVPSSMQRAWNDCTPCANARILAIAPNLDGLANVEVLCGSVDNDVNLVRVIGSLSADPNDPCVTQPVVPAFELSKPTLLFPTQPQRKLVVDEPNGGAVALGGKHGEVWLGPSFSRALPAFLERVPLAVGSFQAAGAGAEVPLAITDQYIAALIDPPPGSLANGFKVFNFRLVSDFALEEDVRLRALVGGAPGWGVLSSADLARLSVRPPLPDGTGNFFKLSYGPRLLSARGEPAREPYFGEAVTTRDGGVVSLVLTADDSVYLAPAPVDSSAPNVQPPLTPQLTPEPGSPIRSFALERTRLGTDGITRVRGYVVTSRNLFTIALGGQPARWSATPLALGGGEPLEVWMDNPRGGLARVGYRDGTVFTLPGGFPLVRPKAGQEPRQVLDYENLGGWPVAYASSGLWVGQWDLLNGKLDNKLADGRPGKPMEWREVTMADGSRPWMAAGGTARPGRLHVLAGPPGTAPPYGQQFKLFLYLADAVYEVGTMGRTNMSAAP